MNLKVILNFLWIWIVRNERKNPRHCEGFSPKQSIKMNRESKANFLLCANLWLDSKIYLLIRFWVIDFICLLDSRDLDTSRYHAQYDEFFVWITLRKSS